MKYFYKRPQYIKKNYNKNNNIKINIDDSNINYNENYEDLTEIYLKPYKNKSLLENIKNIYEEDELKLNDELKLINVDEYKFLIQSLITIDYENLNIKKNEYIKIKLFNHLKESYFSLKDLLRFLKIIEPIFYDGLFYEKNITYAQPIFIFSLLTENNITFEKWKLKYLIYVVKILKLFDVPILKEHNIKKYWSNKYNFEQRREFIEDDLCQNTGDCGTFENMGPASLYYYKDVIKNDEEQIKQNLYPFINDVIIKDYNNIFIDEKQNQIKPTKPKKQKQKNLL
jgi:hypothetical protein